MTLCHQESYLIPLTKATLVTHKVLPKQADIDKILKQINRKILHQTHFPESLKDISAAYLQSPHFHDIYMYLQYNKTPKAKSVCEKIENDAENNMILDTLLFKVVPD